MKTNPLKSLYGLAAVATALTGTALSQNGPERDEPLHIQVVEGDRAPAAEAIEILRDAAQNANPGQRSTIDRAIRRAMADVENDTDPASWRIGVVAGPVDPVLRTHLDLPDSAGVLVTKVVDGSPAAKAGIGENDIIVAAGDRKIDSLETLKDVVRQAGTTDRPLTLAVFQKGKLHQVKINRMPPEKSPNARKPGQDERPDTNMRSMMQQQNRRFEEIQGVLMDMRRRLEQQQNQINALEKKLGDQKTQQRGQRRMKGAPTEGDGGAEAAE